MSRQNLTDGAAVAGDHGCARGAGVEHYLAEGFDSRGHEQHGGALELGDLGFEVDPATDVDRAFEVGEAALKPIPVATPKQADLVFVAAERAEGVGDAVDSLCRSPAPRRRAGRGGGSPAAGGGGRTRARSARRR